MSQKNRFTKPVRKTKQESMLRYIMQGVPEREAALQAGYSEQSVDKNKHKQTELSKQKIQAAKQTFAEECGVTRSDVADIYKDAIQMARTLEDPRTMIAGGDSLSKLAGLTTPEVKINAHVDLTKTNLARMSTKELLKLAEQEGLDIVDAEYVMIDEIEEKDADGAGEGEDGGAESLPRGEAEEEAPAPRRGDEEEAQSEHNEEEAS